VIGRAHHSAVMRFFSLGVRGPVSVFFLPFFITAAKGCESGDAPSFFWPRARGCSADAHPFSSSGVVFFHVLLFIFPPPPGQRILNDACDVITSVSLLSDRTAPAHLFPSQTHQPFFDSVRPTSPSVHPDRMVRDISSTNFARGARFSVSLARASPIANHDQKAEIRLSLVYLLIDDIIDSPSPPTTAGSLLGICTLSPFSFSNPRSPHFSPPSRPKATSHV